MKLAFLIPCFVLGGCATIYMTPHDKAYFSNYPFVGKPVALQRRQELCDVRDDISFRAFRKTVLGTNKLCVGPIIILSEGTEVFIEEVRTEFTPFYGNKWYALGNIEVKSKKYYFEYRFADDRQKFPPPWEPR